MQPAQTLQFLVPERLDTKAQTIDAGFPEAESVSSRDGFRVGLEGDLGVPGHRECAAAGRDNRRDLLGFEQGRRAPPKKIVSAGSPSPRR